VSVCAPPARPASCRSRQGRADPSGGQSLAQLRSLGDPMYRKLLSDDPQSRQRFLKRPFCSSRPITRPGKSINIERNAPAGLIRRHRAVCNDHRLFDRAGCRLLPRCCSGASRARPGKLTARQCSPGSVCEKWPALPLASPPVRSMQAAGSSSPALNWATHWRRGLAFLRIASGATRGT
jgi:hypothetical protein